MVVIYSPSGIREAGGNAIPHPSPVLAANLLYSSDSASTIVREYGLDQTGDDRDVHTDEFRDP
jgi:hypothetical protein